MKADTVIAVYIMANGRNGTIYTGVTSDLFQRVWQHRTGVTPGFAQEHGCKALVWYEQHESMIEAIVREKAIKKWRRGWKLALIERGNPQWKDLGADWFSATVD
ncbi:MAG: endonuclease [Brevundimonas sp.]|jgi:putative endonuclease|uniref:GIY-YIG nuclease family protein n=1 Tax=Brevundimonas albigilva TaxID=1312364 RepID=A0ABY4SPD8_9CAUL|nr:MULTISPECIES: GIY-YIG nuclease family protein [Brevundimonas]PZU54672.1 MAG: endonuclease [Brevundimonas sp.]UQV19311.1 GIY-YIG nuclease family protein [Brevundimonas albigilva]URI15769.1 GIY-YIG nuclease family protein [Brevundimonas albigilva]